MVAYSNGPGSDSYDVVVVGGGMAGLTAGALLACSGRRVLVVDPSDRPGGLARTYEANGFTIDPGVHLIMGGNPDGPFGPGMVYSILDRLGVSDRCDLIPVDPFFTARFPGRSFTVPTGREAYLDAHRRAFPVDGAGFERLVDLHAALLREFLAFPIVPRPSDWAVLPVKYPNLFRYARATLAGVTTRRLSNPRARALYSTLWPYLGLPPGQASFPAWATMMASYIEEGAYYCRGGFQQLADAVATALVDHDGDLALGRSVSRIAVNQGRVEGIVLDDGERISADVVISAADARETFTNLIEPTALPRRWARRIRRGEVSMSSLALYLGTDLDVTDLGITQEHIIQRSWDLDANWQGARAGAVSGMSVTIPTLADPTLAPDGHHHVAIEIAAPSSHDHHAHPSTARQMVAAAEEVIPGLGDHITFAHGNDTPPTSTSDLPLHELGPNYGWAATPSQTGSFRLPQTTPIHGLYLAGHWTQPGHGIWTVMISGLRAARLILDCNTDSGVQPLHL